jgi:hypothetical protein
VILRLHLHLRLFNHNFPPWASIFTLAPFDPSFHDPESQFVKNQILNGPFERPAPKPTKRDIPWRRAVSILCLSERRFSQSQLQIRFFYFRSPADENDYFIHPLKIPA